MPETYSGVHLPRIIGRREPKSSKKTWPPPRKCGLLDIVFGTGPPFLEHRT